MKVRYIEIQGKKCKLNVIIPVALTGHMFIECVGIFPIQQKIYQNSMKNAVSIKYKHDWS